MPMRVKLIAILLLIAAAMFVADGAIERAVVYPKFAALERAEAQRNVRRVERALDREADEVAAAAQLRRVGRRLPLHPGPEPAVPADEPWA